MPPSTTRAICVLIIGAFMAASATAKDSKLKPGTVRYADGTVVKRNADGSLETTDSSPIVQTWTTGSGGTVTSTPKSGKKSAARTKKPRTGTKRYATSGSHGGVYVKKNPDGSIETFDTD